MKVVDKIKSMFSLKQQPLQSNNYRGLQTFFQTITANTLDFDVIKAMQTGYSEVCLSRRQALVSNQKFYVANYNQSTNSYEEIKSNNWLLELIENPSITFDYSFEEIVGLTIRYRDLYGNAYWWLRRSTGNGVKAKYPIEIVVIPSEDVQIQIYNNQRVYEFTLLNVFYQIPQDEIFHFKTTGVPNDTNSIEYMFKGVSNFARALEVDLKNDLYIREYANTELARQGQPSLLIKSQNEIEQNELDSYKDAFRTKFGKYAPAIFGASWGNNIEPLITTASLLSSNSALFKDSLSIDIANRICSIYGFSYDYILNRIPYANLSEAKAILYEQTIEPLTTDFEKQFNRYINKNLDNTVYLQHEQFTYQDKTFELAIMQLLQMSGAITLSELREWAGFDAEIPMELMNETTNEANQVNNDTENDLPQESKSIRNFVRLSLEKLRAN